MFFKKWNFILHVLLTSSIGITSMIGDVSLKHEKSAIRRAIIDNITHAIVGGLTWSVILVLTRKSLLHNVYSIFFAFALSSFIDVDHFLAAGSWSLNDATHLKRRPFLHCTTVPLVTWLILIISSKTFNSSSLNHLSWLIFASFLSHHIRDATRRGLWFCPIGSTQPIPYYIYINMIMVLPYFLYWLMQLHVFSIETDENAPIISIV